MTVIGYARVSTTEQDLSIQQAALKAAGYAKYRLAIAMKKRPKKTASEDQIMAFRGAVT